MVRLSIIIATYNRGERLLCTLHSLASQTLPASRWEAVVVNNNSTDDTAALFARFAADHPSLDLRIVDEERQGLSHARNRGIASSRGPVIAIIDDDEEVNPGFAAAYVDLFDRRPEALMAGGKVIPRYETERPRWMSRFTERPIAGTLDKGDIEKPFGRGYPAGGNMAVRREAFEKHGLFDTSLGRTGDSFTGGEEKELFHRITGSAERLPGVSSGVSSDISPGVSPGERVWWVPGAVIYHIIPPSKLTDYYFCRLSRGVGASERVRTLGISKRAYAAAIAREVLKWGVSVAIALFWGLTLRPRKAHRLLAMRMGITKGLISGR